MFPQYSSRTFHSSSRPTQLHQQHDLLVLVLLLQACNLHSHRQCKQLINAALICILMP
jgi:hypothetical protein